MIKSDLHRRFCDTMRTRRLELGMTQAGLADAAGLQQSVIAAMEAGRNSPTLTTIEPVTKALRIDLAFVLAPEPSAV